MTMMMHMTLNYDTYKSVAVMVIDKIYFDSEYKEHLAITDMIFKYIGLKYGAQHQISYKESKYIIPNKYKTTMSKIVIDYMKNENYFFFDEDSAKYFSSILILSKGFPVSMSRSVTQNKWICMD